MHWQTHWVTVNWTPLLESEAETKIRQLQILLLIRLISAERQVDIMIHLKTRTLFSIPYETQTPQITNLWTWVTILFILPLIRVWCQNHPKDYLDQLRPRNQCPPNSNSWTFPNQNLSLLSPMAVSCCHH